MTDLCVMKNIRFKFKKAIILIAAAISVTIFSVREKGWLVSEKPIVKNVNLKVYRSSGYLSPIYKDVTAKICVTITKVSHNSRAVVWSETFDPLQLREYPSVDQALLKKVAINDVFDGREYLELRSTVSYNVNGNIVEIGDGVLVSKGVSGGTLIIQI